MAPLGAFITVNQKQKNAHSPVGEFVSCNAQNQMHETVQMELSRAIRKFKADVRLLLSVNSTFFRGNLGCRLLPETISPLYAGLSSTTHV